jgi:phospholipase C
LIVSPWAKHGYVSHVNHEFGSILRFVESNFGASSLFQRDVHSDDLSDCFDFNQTFKPFVRVNSPPFHPSSEVESPDDDM